MKYLLRLTLTLTFIVSYKFEIVFCKSLFLESMINSSRISKTSNRSPNLNIVDGRHTTSIINCEEVRWSKTPPFCCVWKENSACKISIASLQTLIKTRPRGCTCSTAQKSHVCGAGALRLWDSDHASRSVPS